MELTNEQITKAFEEVKFALEMLIKTPELKEFYAGKIDGIVRVLNVFGLNEQLNKYLYGDDNGKN